MHWDLQQMSDQFFNETESSIILVIIDLTILSHQKMMKFTLATKTMAL